ncbi:putative reverse transcriptase domain-containing protein, partial [Tanacetum coccineum]
DEKRKAEYGKKLNELKHAITLHRPKSVLDGYNRWMSRGKDCVEPYNLRVDKEVFRQAEDSYFAINPTDIIELLTNKKLELGILTCFEMSLYQLKGRSQQNKVGFLHPEMITPDVYGADKGVTLDYLARALEGYEFYVTPYLQGAHYVLFIICPKHGRGFILDSQKESVFHTEDNYRLAGLVDSVLGGSLKWELPTVNRQPSTWECGYYVMRWMHDFVLKYQNDDFPNTIPWGEERRLENKELDAVIGAWLLITTFSARLLNGLFFMATSAKTAANVNGVFHEIGKSLPRTQPTQNPACMVLVNRPAEGARSASCCINGFKADVTDIQVVSNGFLSCGADVVFQAENEAIFLLLTGIGDEIYSTVDACNTANEMWIAIERLQQGESLNVQDVKTNLFWEFGKFTSRDGESMESYYSWFYKLMNELTRNNLQVTTMQQYQNKVNDIRSERLSKSANPLAFVAAAQPYLDHYYQTPKSKRSNAQASNDPEQAQRDKDMQKNLALLAKYFKKLYKPTNNNLQTSSNSRNKTEDTTPRYNNDNQSGQFGNQRTMTVAGARETVGSQVVQQNGIQQDDWLEDTDEEIDEQELEAHYSFMAKIQEVLPEESSSTDQPLEQDDSNVTPDSSNICNNDNQVGQNVAECVEERVALANLIANLTLDTEENKNDFKAIKESKRIIDSRIGKVQN